MTVVQSVENPDEWSRNTSYVNYMCPSCRSCKILLILSLAAVLYRSSEAANVSNDSLAPTTGIFSSFAQIGVFTTSNDEPHRIQATMDGNIFVGGTTSPLQRGEESDLGLPLRDGLKREDAFIVMVDGSVQNDSSVKWVYRAGTSKEDRLHAMYLDEAGDFLYIAGRTFGSFPGTSSKGLSDIFIIKYDISGDKPVEAWDKPLVLGTVATEAVLAIVADPVDNDVIYATGFTRGKLFNGRTPNGTVDISDAILFAFSARNASIYSSLQFGTENGDHGTGIVVSEDPSGPIFVSVVTDRRIGQYTIGNFHLYKFDRGLAPLGDLLLRTFSREDVVRFAKHPLIQDSLFVTGSSWLDSRNENDVFVKRLWQSFDGRHISSSEVDIDEVEDGEYTRRLQSVDGSHDYATGMAIDAESGRLLICGHTGGKFAQGSSDRGVRAPFIASVDPNDGSLTDARQMEVENDDGWIEISDMTMKGEVDGVYYTLKMSNDTSQQFYVTVGRFMLPPEWKDRIVVKEREMRSESPGPVAESTEHGSNLRLGVIVGAACGGLVGLIVFVGCVCWTQIRKRGKQAKIYDGGLVQTRSGMQGGRERPGRLVGSDELQRRGSELI